MKKWLYILLVPIWGACLQSCASHCYPLFLDTAGPLEHPSELTVVYAGKKYVGDGVVRVPPFGSCEAIPEAATFEWDNESGEHFLRNLPVRGNMPKAFQEKPVNGLVFRITKDDKATVGFRTKLSDITTKELTHPETPAERRQREVDEALWVAVDSLDLNAVKTSLGQGASVFQPWMSRPEFDGAVLNNAFGRGDQRVIEALVRHDNKLTKLLDFPGNSLVWYFVEEQRKDIALLLLRDGANPDYMSEDKSVRPKRVSERILLLAAKAGYTDVVQALLENGASLKFKTSTGEEFSDWARTRATPEIRALLQ